MSRQSQTQPPATIAELDGVRGLAIIMVLVWHYITCQNARASGHPLSFLTAGTYMFWSGVDLFFVLSGFLIGGILLRSSPSPSFYKAFYIRRAARILPVYTVLLITYLLCKLKLNDERYAWLFDSNIPDLAYATFTQNIFMGLKNTFGGHFLAITWSLAVEEQFYLFCPLIMLIFGKNYFKQSVVFFIALAPVLRLTFPGFHGSVNMPFRMDSLLIGVALAIVFQSTSSFQLLKKYVVSLWGFFAVSLWGMAVLSMRPETSFLTPTFIALFYASFIALALIYKGSLLTIVLRFPVFTYFGFYSYGLYMYHEAIAGLFHGYMRNAAPTMETREGALVTLASFAFTVLLAFVSRHTIESYFLKISKCYRY